MAEGVREGSKAMRLVVGREGHGLGLDLSIEHLKCGRSRDTLHSLGKCTPGFEDLVQNNVNYLINRSIVVFTLHTGN